MRSLGNGKYEIKNRDTGETRVVSASELHQYGLSTPEEEAPKTDYSVEGLLNNAKGNVSDLIKSLPAILEQAKQATDVISPAGNKLNIMEDLKGLLDTAAGGSTQTVSDVASFASDPKKFAYERPVDTALYAAGAAGVLPKVVKKTGYGAQISTKKGAARLSEKAAAKATSSGAGVEFGDLSKLIKEEAFKTLGETVEVKRSVQKLISQLTPAHVDNPSPGMFNESSAYTPTKMLTTRRQMGARAGKNFIQKALSGDSIGDKVDNIARRVISNKLHEIAPETKLPDKAYSFYSKGGPFGGDIPTLLLKYGIGAAAGKKLIPELMKYLIP